MIPTHIKWPGEHKQREDESDEEYMWRKLSTVPQPNYVEDLTFFYQQMARGFRHKEITVIMAKPHSGKSRFDIEGEV